MTREQKKSLVIMIPFVIALMGCWYIEAENKVTGTGEASPQRKSPQTLKVELDKARALASVSESLHSPITTPATSHPVWKENLERTLRTQGGALIKNVKIEKVDSFDWKVGKIDVRVDSIKVSLQNEQGQRSSFRAIVDASSGKVLQTWDQPIIDNFSAKTSGTIKIDSRYHND